MTQRAAESISEATGISLEWLMNANIKASPVGVDDSHYNLATFEKWISKLQSKHARPTSASPSFPLQQILLSLYAAQKKGQSSTAFFHLRQFSELMRSQFGQDSDRAGAVGHARKLLAEIDGLLGHGSLHAEEEAQGRETFRKMEI